LRDDQARLMSIAQFRGHPRRSYYTGSNLARALTIGDLRARTHKRMPRFVLEYLEGGAEDEATLAREREAQNEWHFVTRTLVDVSARTPEYDILGVKAPMPLIVAPTGLNGVFCRGADVALATGAAAAGVPFVQSTMSNDTIEHVAAVGRPAPLVPALRVRRGTHLAQSRRSRRGSGLRGAGPDQQLADLWQPRMGGPHASERQAFVRDHPQFRDVSRLARAYFAPRHAGVQQRDRFRAEGASRFLRQRDLDPPADAEVAVLGYCPRNPQVLEKAVPPEGPSSVRSMRGWRSTAASTGSYSAPTAGDKWIGRSRRSTCCRACGTSPATGCR